MWWFLKTCKIYLPDITHWCTAQCTRVYVSAHVLMCTFFASLYRSSFSKWQLPMPLPYLASDLCLAAWKNRFTYTYGFNWTEYFDNIIVYKWNNSYLKERAPVSAKSMQKPQQGKHLQWRVLNCNWGRQSRCKELLKRRHTHREISIWKCQTQHPFTWSMSWINTLLATFL